MVAVALEQQAALPGRAGGVEPSDRLIAGTEYAVLAVDREPAFRVHEHRA